MELKTFNKEDGQKLLDTTDWDEVIEAKGLTLDEKTEFLRFCLTNPDNRNLGCLINVALVVKSSTLDEKEFEPASVIFNDLEEFIDIKQELKPEIRAFRNELAKYFLASFKSMAVVLPDGKISIPEAYRHILITLSLEDMAKILHSADIDYNTLPLVFDGESVIYGIMGVSPLMKEICDALQSALPPEE